MVDSFSGAEEVHGLTTPTIEAFLERDAVPLPRRLIIRGQQSPGSGRWRHSDTGILCRSFHEWPPNKIPKVKEAGGSPLHHLEEAQALLPNLLDHSPHQASPAKHHGKSRSNWKDIKIGFGAEILRTQIRDKDNNQRSGLGRLHR